MPLVTKKKRGKGKGRGKTTEETPAADPPAKPPTPPQDAAESEEEEVESVHLEPLELVDCSSDEKEKEASTQPPLLLGKRKKGKEEERHFKWTEEKELDLIEWWRENECLYNTQIADFHLPQKKLALYEQKAKDIGQGCDGEAVRHHLKYLRDRMVRILNDTGPSGRGLDGEIDPKKLWGRIKFVYDNLEFIRPFLTPRASKSSTKTTLGTDDEAEEGDDDTPVAGTSGKSAASTSTSFTTLSHSQKSKKAKAAHASKSAQGAEQRDLDMLKKVINETIGKLPADSSEKDKDAEVESGLEWMRCRIMRLQPPERYNLLDHLMDSTKQWMRISHQTPQYGAPPAPPALQSPMGYQTYPPQQQHSQTWNYPTGGQYYSHPQSLQASSSATTVGAPTGTTGHVPTAATTTTNTTTGSFSVASDNSYTLNDLDFTKL